MRRGTTPVHTFATDADLTGASVLFVTYQQRGKTVLEKSLGDAGVTVTVTVDDEELTQGDGEYTITVYGQSTGGVWSE